MFAWHLPPLPSPPAVGCGGAAFLGLSSTEMISLELHFGSVCRGKADGFARGMTGGMRRALNKRNKTTRQTFITSLHTL